MTVSRVSLPSSLLRCAFDIFYNNLKITPEACLPGCTSIHGFGRCWPAVSLVPIPVRTSSTPIFSNHFSTAHLFWNWVQTIRIRACLSTGPSPNSKPYTRCSAGREKCAQIQPAQSAPPQDAAGVASIAARRYTVARSGLPAVRPRVNAARTMQSYAVAQSASQLALCAAGRLLLAKRHSSATWRPEPAAPERIGSSAPRVVCPTLLFQPQIQWLTVWGG
jgi:hypothetical protein